MNKDKIIKMAELAILTAIVIIFQWLGQFVHIGPTSITLVLIPIVLGGVVLGPSAGTFLGLVFGIMTIIAGYSGHDPFTNQLLIHQPIETMIICLVKGCLCGFFAALAYKALKKHNKTVACFVAAAIAPIVNTGLFILGGLFLVNQSLTSAYLTDGQSLVYFLVILCAGLNFIGEFILNIVLAPILKTISDAVTKKIR